MRKLRTFLAAALLTIPLTLNAGALTAEVEPGGIQSTQSLTGTCWVYYGGRWWVYPC